MHSKLAILFVSAASIASVSAGTAKCNVGKLQCCQEVHKPTDQAVQKQLGLFNLAAGTISGLVGVQCSPLSVLAGGTGSNCDASPVCCTGNTFNGVIAIGCTPININL